jgi:amidase
LSVLSGAHPRDPWSIDPPPERSRGKKALRIAAIAEPPGGATDPAVAKVVRDAGAALREAGYEVVEAVPPRYEEAAANWAQFVVGDFVSMRGQMEPIMGEDGAFFFRVSAAAMPPLDAAAMSMVFVARHSLARAWSQFMHEYPLVLSPVWTQLPFEAGFDIASPENVGATLQLIRPVLPANLFGLPSACVPAGRDAASGLPVGVLLTGRRMRDEECLDAAEAIESRLGLKTPVDPI